MQESKKNFLRTNNYYVGMAIVVVLFAFYAFPKIADHLGQSKRELAMMPDHTIPEFQLVNQEGELMGSDFYKGKVYVAEFFFTTCPSICLIMNQNMTLVQKSFIGRPDFGIASFSVNPEYDTPEILADYGKRIGAVHPNWHFFTGDQKEIYDLGLKGFFVNASEDEVAPGGFLHSEYFILVDRDGRIRSRLDEYGNPRMVYDGTNSEHVQQLITDAELLLNQP